MQIPRPARERGTFDHGWLKTAHTFSFGEYHDPQWERFQSLRVMNDDWIAPGQGFGMHGHREMEILTIVLDGALAHRDSLGHAAELRADEAQRMTAGTGIRHSEFNPSATEATALYQIWLFPDRLGRTPEYEQRPFALADRLNHWQTITAPDGRDGSLSLHQDAVIVRSALATGASLTYDFAPGRAGWLQVLRGAVLVDGTPFHSGDGLGLTDEPRLSMQATAESDLLLFDLGSMGNR